MSRPSALILSTAALAGFAMGGCFRDDRPPLGCAAVECGEAMTDAGATTGSAEDPSSSSTTDAPTGTTGEPAAGRAFRIDSLAIVDPHLFFGECADGTMLLNEALTMKIDGGEFNMVLWFDEFTLDGLTAELTEAESCDPAAMTCTRKQGQVALQVPVEQVSSPPCSQLDPAVIGEGSAPLLHEATPTCFRTARAELALPINGAGVPLNMREAQVVFNFDVPEDAQAVMNGLLYGFLTKESADTTSINIFGMDVPLWPMIEVPDCDMMYPEYLPSVDALQDGDQKIVGVWLAANFTATRVELLPAP